MYLLKNVPQISNFATVRLNFEVEFRIERSKFAGIYGRDFDGHMPFHIVPGEFADSDVESGTRPKISKRDLVVEVFARRPFQKQLRPFNICEIFFTPRQKCSDEEQKYCQVKAAFEVPRGVLVSPRSVHPQDSEGRTT
jgi:hypothetical protein